MACKRREGPIVGYLIRLDDGRWIKVSENIYRDWTGEKDYERESPL